MAYDISKDPSIIRNLGNGTYKRKDGEIVDKYGILIKATGNSSLTSKPKFNLFDFQTKVPGTTTNAIVPSTTEIATKVEPKRNVFTPSSPASMVKPVVSQPTQSNGIIKTASAAEFTPDDINNFRDLLSKGIEPERAKSLIFKAKGLTTQSQPKQEGFLDRLGESASKRFEQAGKQQATGIEGGLQFGGALGGFVGDLAGNILTSAYETAGEPGKEMAQGLLKTEVGQKAVKALGEGVESYNRFKAENPRTANALENIVNITNLIPAGIVRKKTGETVAKQAPKVIKQTGKVISKTGEGITSTTEYGTKLLTGLNRETQQAIKSNPKLFKSVKEGVITPESITGDLQTRIKGRLNTLSETGKGYQELKKSDITFPKQEIQGIYDNRLNQEGLSKSLIELPIEDRNAIKQAQYYLNELPTENLTTKEAIELKAKLRSLVSYDKGVSPEGERVVKGLLKDLDTNLKTKIPGFKELDEVYGPEREFLNKVQKDIFNKDGTLKDTAISTIRNLTGKGKENKLGRLEKIMPGIGEKVKGIKAYEDLQNAIEGKTGSYARGALIGGGGFIAGGPIGGIITFAITHPSVASKTLEIYGLSKGKINNLFNKFKSKTPLNNIEQTQLKEAIKTPSNKVFNNLVKNDGLSTTINSNNINSNIQQKVIKPSILSDKEKLLIKQQNETKKSIIPNSKSTTSKTSGKDSKKIIKKEPTLSDRGGVKTIAPEYQHKFNQGADYEAVRVISNPKDSKIIRYGTLENKIKQSVIGKGSKLTEGEKLELKSIEKELGMSREDIMKRSNEIKELAKGVRSKYDQVILDLNKPTNIKKAYDLSSKKAFINPSKILSDTKDMGKKILNSNGLQLAKTGNPIKTKVYHGTEKVFNEFDSKFLGSNTGNTPTNKAGFSFTDNKEVAKTFGRNIKEKEVSLNNPLVIDAKGQDYGQFKHILNEKIEYAQKKGYDGIVVKNYKDAGLLSKGDYIQSNHIIEFPKSDTKKIVSPSDDLIKEAIIRDKELINKFNNYDEIDNFKYGYDEKTNQLSSRIQGISKAEDKENLLSGLGKGTLRRVLEDNPSLGGKIPQEVTIYRVGDGTIKPGDMVAIEKSISKTLQKERGYGKMANQKVSPDEIVIASDSQEFYYVPKELQKDLGDFTKILNNLKKYYNPANKKILK